MSKDELHVFDTSSFRVLRHYYPATFESVWLGIEQLVDQGLLVSTREVFTELENFNETSHILHWAKNHKGIFATPSNEELEFVARIFQAITSEL
jgi:hypothetical protein